MMCLLGEELASKSLDLDMQVKETDEFLEYLKSIEGKWLYADDRKKIVKQFEDIGVKLRRAGINTLNGALEDQYEKRYKCRFRNKQLDSNGKLTRKNLVDKRKKLDDGSENVNRDKTYWILEQSLKYSGVRLTLHYIYSGMPILPPKYKKTLRNQIKFVNS